MGLPIPPGLVPSVQQAMQQALQQAAQPIWQQLLQRATAEALKNWTYLIDPAKKYGPDIIQNVAGLFTKEPTAQRSTPQNLTTEKVVNAAQQLSARRTFERAAAASGIPPTELIDRLRSLVICPRCETPMPHLEEKGPQRCKYCRMQYCKYQCFICGQWYASGFLFDSVPCGPCRAAGRSKTILRNALAEEEYEYRVLLGKLNSVVAWASKVNATAARL